MRGVGYNEELYTDGDLSAILGRVEAKKVMLFSLFFSAIRLELCLLFLFKLLDYLILRVKDSISAIDF